MVLWRRAMPITPGGWRLSITRAGAHIRKANGSWGVVASKKFALGPKVMYNLTVAQAHTFFVGQQQWLVHNDCGQAFSGPTMRHYTNRKGLNGIKDDMEIKASENQWGGNSDCVFCEKANKKPMAPRDAESYYGLDRGYGRDYVEFDTAPAEAQSVVNPTTGNKEWVIEGDVDLTGRNPKFVSRQ